MYLKLSSQRDSTRDGAHLGSPFWWSHTRVAFIIGCGEGARVGRLRRDAAFTKKGFLPAYQQRSPFTPMVHLGHAFGCSCRSAAEDGRHVAATLTEEERKMAANAKAIISRAMSGLSH